MFLARVQGAAAGSGVEIAPSFAAFAKHGQRREYVASARAGSGAADGAAGGNAAGCALAVEYESVARCTFARGWEAFRKRRVGDGVRVLVFEGVVGGSGGCCGAHAGAAHCQLVVSGVVDGTSFIYEPFALDWARLCNVVPSSVGAFPAEHTKTLAVKLVRGDAADDGKCRARCLAIVAALASGAKEAARDAVGMPR